MQVQYLSLIILLIFSITIIVIFPLRFGRLFNLIDTTEINDLKIHKFDTPKLGGLIILLIFLTYYIYELSKNGFTKEQAAIFLLYLSFFFVGLLDDYINLSPLIRIILFSLIVYIVSAIQNEIVIEKFFSEIFNRFLHTGNLSIIFTIICFIFLQNAFNLFDGVNGNLLLYCTILNLLFCFYNNSIFLLLTLLILLILTIQNFRNKLFLGNNGSSILSAFIAAQFILKNNVNSNLFSFEQIIILLFLPSIDMIRLFIIRIINKKNPFIGDLNHLHHKIVNRFNIGWANLNNIFFILIGYLLSLIISSFYVILLLMVIYVFQIWSLRKIQNL